MEERKKPICLYCGYEMKLHNAHNHWWYRCINEECRSGSPIKNLPDEAYNAATQRADRPKGKWARVLDIHHERYWCSECMGIADKRSNFCPNCGADMRSNHG